MSLATLNGREVLAMRLTMPAVGIWVLSAELSADAPVEGAVVLEQGGVTMRGATVRSGALSGSCRIEAVGGTGGLLRQLGARSFHGVTARSVLSDVLASAGESLDASSSRSALASTLAYWTRARGRASEAVATLASALGAKWRVLPSGSVWMGLEAWPRPTGYEYEELDRDAGGGTVLLAPETVGLAPGMLLGADRVGRVEHIVGPDTPLRTTYWMAEDA